MKKLLILLILFSYIYADDLRLKELSTISGEHLFNLDRDRLKNAIKPYLDTNPNIKGLKIIEELDKEEYLLFFRENGKFYYGKEIPQNIRALKEQKLEIFYSGEKVGEALVYYIEKKSLLLSEDEALFLKEKKEIKFCCNPDFMPFESIDENLKHIGICSDYMDIISAKLDIPFELVQTTSYLESKHKLLHGDCNIISEGEVTDNGSKKFLYTKPYIEFPRVFATHIDEKFVSDFSLIADGKVGIQKDSSTKAILLKLYPNIKLIEYVIVDEGLQDIASGAIDVYVGPLPTISYSLQKQALSNVKIGGVVVSNIQFSILINEKLPQLVSILNKAIDNISIDEKREIFNKWISIKYEKGIDYTLLWQVIGIFSVLVLFVLYRNWQARIYTQELKKKDEILLYQARTSAMGDMSEMLAHQWKQPLHIINMISNNIKLDIELDSIDKAVFSKYSHDLEAQTKHLSDTIANFKDYFKPTSQKEEQINVLNVMDDALKVMQKIFENSDIQIIKEYNDIKLIDTFPNELLQVFINILKNAKDVLIERNIEDKKVWIVVEQLSEKLLRITIEDSGGGISIDNTNKIFEPYYSTKSYEIGKGLGLYTSTVIIKKYLKGSLNVTNSENGAMFIITLPIK